MTNTTLYKCFIPIDTSTDYAPNADSDIFALNELGAVELLLNEENHPITFPPHTLSEMPKHIQKKIEQAERKRTHIQSILKIGNVNEIRKIKLVFAAIKIAKDNIPSITGNQADEKYLRISLQNAKYSIAIYEKHITELDRESNADTGKVTIKRLLFAD